MSLTLDFALAWIPRLWRDSSSPGLGTVATARGALDIYILSRDSSSFGLRTAAIARSALDIYIYIYSP